jgi:hypothetical protein
MYPRMIYNNRKPNNMMNNDRFIGGGFLGPFILGGITGGLLAPAFYPRPYPMPYYGPPVPNSYPPYQVIY